MSAAPLWKRGSHADVPFHTQAEMSRSHMPVPQCSAVAGHKHLMAERIQLLPSELLGAAHPINSWLYGLGTSSANAQG